MRVHPLTPWWLPVLLTAGLSLVSSMYVNKIRTTAANDLSTSQRLTAVEIHQQDTTARLDRIEAKVDTIIDKMLK